MSQHFVQMKHGEAQGVAFFSDTGVRHQLSSNSAHVYTVRNPAFQIAKCLGVKLGDLAFRDGAGGQSNAKLLIEGLRKAGLPE